MTLSLGIRSKVNSVHNSNIMYKNSIKCNKWPIFSVKICLNYQVYTYNTCGTYIITEKSTEHVSL